ncbi:hypothetical protein CAPN008_06120 [Capnocytophaga canis]|uniref:hypothetical protein n=1 Tax=Capnocytophaga canis TaxID=1848903 RepID=UPI001ACF6D53|nr:hypothetical protein [Capnocytophaga canis]GIM60562.1 hypothetical protein CAPN008_06120 [Capnocytophaga canis]
MKKIIWLMAIAFCLIPIACKTKQVTTHKETERLKTEFQRKLDSLGRTFEEYAKENQKQKLSENKRIELRALDSTKPLIYSRKENGVLVEEINLSGGVLVQSTIQDKQNIHEKETQSRKSEANVQFSENGKSISQKGIFHKEKHVKGWDFSFWAWLWLIIILLLLFFAWRLKFFG